MNNNNQSKVKPENTHKIGIKKLFGFHHTPYIERESKRDIEGK